jgi:membrane glycosyltransferase
MVEPGWLRRIVLLVLVVLGTGAATRLLASILSADGLSLPEAALLGLFSLTFAWICFAFWTAMIGFCQLALGRLSWSRRGLAEPAGGAPITTRTALAIPVYHEDPDQVGARVAAMYRSLERTGQLEHFDLFILSDSRDPQIALREETVWADLCAELGAGNRLFYRRRPRNEGRKSGNLTEFCRRWGRRYDFFIVLDADSVMTGGTLVRLVSLMQANPSAGLIQTVPQPIRSLTLFARMQQFAARLYSPLFAAGTAFWYPGKSNYWGHNAIIRTKAFMAHCGLPMLPGLPPLGGEIMSHDFIEAALMRRGGWDVWLEPGLGGSYEELPPTIDDYAKRDRRWCQGNMQHARLLGLKGLCPVSRSHLALGVMSYLASPLWFLLLLLSTVEAARADLYEWAYFPDAYNLFPVWPIARAFELLSLFGITMAMLVMTKLLAMGLALVRRQQRLSFGGGVALVRSVLVEILFAALLAPILMVQQSLAVVATLVGRTVGWNAQRREGGGGERWLQAASRYAGATALGISWGAIAYWLAPDLLVWLSPVLFGLVLSIPLAVLTGRPGLGIRARRRGWFVTPEEVAPPRELVEVADREARAGLADLPGGLPQDSMPAGRPAFASAG